MQTSHTQTQTELCSVELATTAKGELTIVVKAYAETVAQAAARAVAVFDQLHKRYHGIEPPAAQG